MDTFAPAKKRYPELDFVKAIAIMMVVTCHYYQMPKGSFAGNVTRLLCHTAVPCFFMCSGYLSLFRPISLKKQVYKIAGTYGLIVAWRAFYYLFYYITKYWSVKGNGIVAVLSCLFLFQPLRGVTLGYFWFMDAFLAMQLIMPLFCALFQQPKKGLVVWGILLFYFSNQFIYSVNLFSQAVSGLMDIQLPDAAQLTWIIPFADKYHYILLYVLLGGAIRMIQDNGLLSEKRQFFVFAVLFVIGMLDLLWVYHFQHNSWVWTGDALIDEYHWSGLVLLSVGMFGLQQQIGKSPWTQKIGHVLGKHTLGIYMLHIPVLHLVFPIWERIVGENITHGSNLFKTFVVLSISLGLTMMGRKIPLIRKMF